MTPWKELVDPEREEAWELFYKVLQFRPGMKKCDWPGIHEPDASTTYSISHAYEVEDLYLPRTNDLCTKIKLALMECTDPQDFVYALDWQHPCYKFWPHEPFPFETEDDWPIPPLPNGDYYSFVSPDLTFGVFGHPWEQTMCVFGAKFMRAVDNHLPDLFTEVVRRNGWHA